MLLDLLQPPLATFVKGDPTLYPSMKTRTQHRTKFYRKVLQLPILIVITIYLFVVEVVCVSGPENSSHGSFNSVRHRLPKRSSEMVSLGIRIYDGMEQTGTESEDTSWVIRGSLPLLVSCRAAQASLISPLTAYLSSFRASPVFYSTGHLFGSTES